MINQAYAEVSEILNHLDSNLYSKIPQSFINFINTNKDSNYKTTLDFSKSINNQNLLSETRILLSLIYRDFLCSPEKRKELIEKDNEALRQEEEKLRKSYEITFNSNDSNDNNNINANNDYSNNNNINNSNINNINNNNSSNNILNTQNTEETSIAVIKKENWIVRFFKKIFKKKNK